MTTTQGVLYVHSAPSALCPHIEWAAGGVLSMRPSLEWTPQPAAPRTWRAELSWQGAPGTAARLASALRGWEHLRFEVTEEPSTGSDGSRYSATPKLGIFAAVIGVHGDIQLPEERLRGILARGAAGQSALIEELERALGRPWDEELEPFRYAGEGAPVRWLHQVG